MSINLHADDESEALLERLGILVDTADNYSMYVEDPLWLHKDSLTQGALRQGFKVIREEAKALYIALGGEDVWATYDTLDDEMLPPASYAGGN